MPAKVHQFMCLQDNFGVLLHDEETGATAAIDAPETAAVEKALADTGWRLTDILVTHHHNDHTAGVPDLKRKYGCRVVAPRGKSAEVTNADATIGEGDTVTVGNLTAQILETPGHTTDHISYWFEADKLAFLGDTLFSIGCGRVIEGSMAMMWDSLAKLRTLPDETTFYCGHEYTKANVAFALTIDPDNAALRMRATEVDALRLQGKPTLPGTLGIEKAANPFLRVDDPALATRLGLAGRPAAEVFAKIRGAKDTFRG